MWTSFAVFLKSELDSSKIKNPQYSLRSFARFLGVDSSLLSKIMTEKRRPSRALIDSVCTKLNVSSDQRTEFVKLYHLNKRAIPRKLQPQSLNETPDITENILKSIHLLNTGMGIEEATQITGDTTEVLKQIHQMITDAKLIYNHSGNSSKKINKLITKKVHEEINHSIDSSSEVNFSYFNSVLRIAPENIPLVNELAITYLKKIAAISLRSSGRAEDFYTVSVGIQQCTLPQNKRTLQS